MRKYAKAIFSKLMRVRALEHLNPHGQMDIHTLSFLELLSELKPVIQETDLCLQATDALISGLGSALSHVLLMVLAAGALSLLINVGTWLWGAQASQHYMGYEAPPSPYGEEQ